MLQHYQTKKEEHPERVGMFVTHTMWCLFFISPSFVISIKKGSVLDFHGPFANSFLHSLVGTSIKTCILISEAYDMVSYSVFRTRGQLPLTHEVRLFRFCRTTERPLSVGKSAFRTSLPSK